MTSDENSENPGDFQPVNDIPEALERGFRVRDVVRSAGGRTKLSELTGIPANTLASYTKGVEMKLTNAVRLADACGVTVEWLATGRPPKVRPQAAPEMGLEATTSLRDGKTLKAPHREEVSKYALIPSYQINESGLPLPAPDQAIEVFAFDKSWLESKIALPSADLSLIEVHGHYMSPFISHGDIVLIDIRHRSVEGEGYYAVSVGRRISVRKMHLRADGMISMRGGTPRYPAEVVPREAFFPNSDHEREMLILGIVVWRSSLVSIS